ncbi:hypothetical protein C6P45_004975 [Maudiozyma exigua]|uniref:Vacuolar protein sorting-associated protein 16 homolog n=1 Tax=Maudiozyma exigua TaxID=34358 RepID=A0A9P6W9H0_MAUEX|nr:hypothetical protein C6P45_004975 [Kazachstania exigua]
MIQNPSLSWEKLQNVFYRSRKLHDLQWSSKTDILYTVSRLFIAIQTDKSIQIFNHEGILLSDIDIGVFDTIVSFYFDKVDHKSLIVVGLQTCKIVRSWSPLQIKTINLPSDINDSIWDVNNNILITKNNKDIFRLDTIKGKFKKIFKNEDKYNILTKKHWDCNDNILIILDTESVFQIDLYSGKITKFKENNEWHQVTISKNGFICLYNAKNNKLNIFNSSSNLLLEHNLDIAPDNIKWCGDDSIACTFNDTVKLYAPDGEYVSFWYPSNIFCVETEIDGLKVFTDTDVHIVTRVGSYTADIYCMGSTEAGSMLLDAWRLLSTHTARAIDYLKDFDLINGINDCISAAQDEFNSQSQKELLNAATFGKSMLAYNEFDSDVFVRACDNIKLMKVFWNLGFFLTYQEYQDMGFETLINVLLQCHKFYECLQICKEFKRFYLVVRILEKWADIKIKISGDIDDNDLFDEILNRIDSTDERKEVSTSKLAQTAFEEGRFALARQFAMIEKSPELKVLALIKLDDYILAAQESLKCKCPDILDDPLLKQDSDFLKRNETLIDVQEELSNALSIQFVGLSMDQTIEKLLSIKQEKKLKMILKKFKVNDKKYYHIVCRTLIGDKRFEDLYEFATQKKSPIGYLPFYKYLKKANKQKEAARYIPMITEMSYKDKIKTLYEVKGYYELAQMFTKEKNILALKDLYQQVPPNEPQLRSFITETISKM